MEFTVQRETWINGLCLPAAGKSKLLNGEGFMCCLGHCCLQLGVAKQALLGAATPASLGGRNLPTLNPFTLGDWGNALSAAAMGKNDSAMCKSIEEKEKALKAVFASYGHTLSFVGTHHKHYAENNEPQNNKRNLRSL